LDQRFSYPHTTAINLRSVSHKHTSLAPSIGESWEVRLSLLLLPHALAGVLCVALLYHLVGRSFGPEAGLLATLALATTPISVATNLHNKIRIVYVL
jgi:hypothetical protein